MEHLHLNIKRLCIYLFTGVISWTSEFTTDEDLSGVTPIKTTGNSLDWTQEPTTTNTTSENWANFTSVSFGKKSETKWVWSSDS